MSGKKISAATANNPAAKNTKKPAAAKPAAKAASTSSKKASKSFRSTHSHLFPKTPRDFGIGRALPPKKDLSRVVRWPAYVRLQRQRAILKKRLKVPPSIAQFTRTLDKNQAANLFRLLSHYRPESRKEKATRLKAKAESQVKAEKGEKKADDPKATTKPVFVKYGLNHITALVEAKKAKLVVIAHDVEPIELVVWLPSLCRKMNIPYVIVKGKARLGHIVHKKTASVLALTEVRKEDAAKLEQFVANVRVHFNDDVAGRKKWGGQVLGFKAQQVIRKRAAAVAAAVSKA